MGIANDDSISIDDASIAQDLTIHCIPLQMLEPAAGHQTLACWPVLQPNSELILVQQQTQH